MTAIIALSDNNVVGVDQKLPWRLSHDMKFFKANTWGGTVVMGRRTWESIGRPLPGRKNMVLSRSKYAIDGVKVIQHLEEVPSDAYWIGGKNVLEQAFARNKIHRVILTRVHRTIEKPKALKLFLPRMKRIFRSRDYDGYHFEILVKDS